MGEGGRCTSLNEESVQFLTSVAIVLNYAQRLLTFTMQNFSLSLTNTCDAKLCNDCASLPGPDLR